MASDIRITSGGQNNRPIVAATVESLAISNPLDVILTGPSGEQYPSRSRSANFGRVNVTNAATQVLASNKDRLGFIVQNLESQQLSIGFASTITVRNGVFLAPTANSSGDGGIMIVTDYTGEVHAITASGDVDVSYAEFVR